MLRAGVNHPPADWRMAVRQASLKVKISSLMKLLRGVGKCLSCGLQIIAQDMVWTGSPGTSGKRDYDSRQCRPSRSRSTGPVRLTRWKPCATIVSASDLAQGNCIGETIALVKNFFGRMPAVFVKGLGVIRTTLGAICCGLKVGRFAGLVSVADASRRRTHIERGAKARFTGQVEERRPLSPKCREIREQHHADKIPRPGMGDMSLECNAGARINAK